MDGICRQPEVTCRMFVQRGLEIRVSVKCCAMVFRHDVEASEIPRSNIKLSVPSLHPSDSICANDSYYQVITSTLLDYSYKAFHQNKRSSVQNG